MVKVDYNIEFAHIYSDSPNIENEQMGGVRVAKKIIKEIIKEGKTYALTVLIDEYHPVVHRLNLNKFLSSLAELGTPPTYVAYESRMIPASEILLKAIPKKVRVLEKMHTDLTIKKKALFLSDTKKRNKDIRLKTLGGIDHSTEETCALLATAWYLLRLGLVQAKNPVELTGLTQPKPFVGKKIINILPAKYKNVEDSTLEIIKATTQFKKYANKIRSVLY
jgi:hypothetical protein